MNNLNRQIIERNFLLLIFLFTIMSGCGPSGPSLPIKSINNIEHKDLKKAVAGLYERRSDKVLMSLEKISEMEENALPAIPYLVTMLSDKRLAKKKNYGFVKTVPIFKKTAITLGDLGEEGIYALVDSLRTTTNDKGIDDDFIREAVALGLKKGQEKWGDSPYKKMRNTKRVEYILSAVSACLELSENPGRFDHSDPRSNLKYYKHFLPLAAREDLTSYIDILGRIGDERALAVLSRIVTSNTGKSFQSSSFALSKIQRASAIAQYYIKPIKLEHIKPKIAEYLFIEFIVQGKTAFVVNFLKEGMNPNVQTLTREPVVSLAFKKQHIEIYQLLVENGADLNVRLRRKNTLLIRAAEKGDFLFAEQLIKSGADVSLRNNAGHTALDATVINLIDFWDGKETEGEAEPYLKIINLLRKSGSPDVTKAVLKTIDKKTKKVLVL